MGGSRLRGRRFSPDLLNTVIAGDCLDILPDFPASCVDLVVTSPPYNVGLDYGPLVDDRRPWDDYYEWLEQVLAALYRVLKPGGVLALNVPKEVKLPHSQIETEGQRVQKIATLADGMCARLGYLPRESIVWVKGNEGMPISSTSQTGSDNNIYLRSVAEMILLYSKDRYYYDGGTGRRGADDVPWKDESKDVWWIPAAHRDGNGHPCPFPAEVPRRLIDLFTRLRPDKGFVPLVLDPFAGTGMVGIVARQMGRDFIGIEVVPEWAARATEQIAATQQVFAAPVVSTATLTRSGAIPTMVTRLPVSAISIDPSLNCREGLDEATVEQYAAIFDRLPPVTVFRQPDGTHLLSAGFHRIAAAKQLGLAEIKAEMREGTRADAEEFAILDNTTHGKPYTRAERRQAAERLLKLHPDWADNRLAALLAMSKNTVAAIRLELESACQIDRLDELVGADGKTYPRWVTEGEGDGPEQGEGATDLQGTLNGYVQREDEGDGNARQGQVEMFVMSASTADRAEAWAEAEGLDEASPATSPAVALLDFPAIPPPDAVDLSRVLLAQANSVRLPLADESVHCIAFSPPYWALRRYTGETQSFVWPGVEYSMPGTPDMDAVQRAWAAIDPALFVDDQACDLAFQQILAAYAPRVGVSIPGDPNCEHEWTEQFQLPQRGAIGDKSTLGGGQATQAASRLREPGRHNHNTCTCGTLAPAASVGECKCGQGASSLGTADRYQDNLRDLPAQSLAINVCAKCGALRCPLGHEPTPEAYIGHLVLLLREARRVLRPDGTLWLNLGFSYYGGGQGPGSEKQATVRGSDDESLRRFKTKAHPVYAAKDLVPIPWLVATAAQYDGWYLRSPVVWSKPAAMPSSTGDRPTLDYEHVLLLTRSDRYYYNIDAIRDPLNVQFAQRRLVPRSHHPKYDGMPAHRRPDYELRNIPEPEGHPLGRNKRTTWDPLSEASGFALELHQAGHDLDWSLRFALGLDPDESVTESESLWRVNPFQYHEAHYAAWPPALVARMIQAGSSPAVCAACGTPWQRVAERAISTYPASDDPTLDTGRAGFDRPRPGPSERRVMSVPQAEIAAYLRQSVDGKEVACRERYGSKWEHWTRTDDSGARLPTPEDWLNLKKLLGLDDRYDEALLPKNLVVAERDGKHNYRDGGAIRESWDASRRDMRLLGWRPDCACFDHALSPDFAPLKGVLGTGKVGDDAAHPACSMCGLPHTTPAKVLDIAAGSGTTVQATRLLGRVGIGFDISHEYLRDLAQKRVAQAVKLYRQPEVPPVVRRGPLPESDVVIGDMAAVLPGLPPASVDLLFLDPPFNLDKDYGGGGVDDAQSDARYWELLTFWLDLALPLIKPTGSLVLHHVPEWAFRAASYLEGHGLLFRRWVAWRALSGWTTMREGFRPEHYAFVWFSRGETCDTRTVLAPHPRCARCGDYSTDWGGKEPLRDEAGIRMGDIWQLERAHHAGHKGRIANELPVEAVLRWVLALTDPGDYVLDPTMGSGTTAAACELAGRRWGGVEIVADNLSVIRVKAAMARGAREVACDVDALAADVRVALGNELARAWGADNVAPLWLDRGREAARRALVADAPQWKCK